MREGQGRGKNKDMKRTIIILALLSLMGTIYAQKPSSNNQVLSAIADVQRKNAATRHSYAFRQTKHSPMLAEDAVSKGTMTVGPSRHLIWHYTEPNDMALVVEGDDIYMTKNGVRSELKGTSGRITRRLAALMVELSEGESLTDEGQFKSSLEETADRYIVVLEPRKRELKRMMQRTELTFSRQGYAILSVKIVEKDDSYTLIEFKK